MGQVTHKEVIPRLRFATYFPDTQPAPCIFFQIAILAWHLLCGGQLRDAGLCLETGRLHGGGWGVAGCHEIAHANPYREFR